MIKTEIAIELKVDQTISSRDIKVLKGILQWFVFYLAKSDLAYYYKQCLDGIQEDEKVIVVLLKSSFEKYFSACFNTLNSSWVKDVPVISLNCSALAIALPP